MLSHALQNKFLTLTNPLVFIEIFLSEHSVQTIFEHAMCNHTGIRMKKIYFIIVTVSIFWSNSTISQSSPNLNNSIEQIVEKYMDSLSLVGVSVSVIQNNDIKFKKSFGYANLEFDAPMTNASVYRIWSISKQFCAVSILKLETMGKLKLSDPVNKYLDLLPPTWNEITIEHLLNQTGGIKDYLNDYKEGQKLHSTSFEIVRDSTSILKFEPGEAWSYTNTGYWVLAKIVESVSGLQYHNFLQEEYFKPLKMESTQKMDYYKIIKNRVSGYRSPNNIPINSTRYLDEKHLALGDADLISTLNDLTNWALALFSDQIIPRGQLGKAWTKNKKNNGEFINAKQIIYYDENASYGLGWFISELNGKKIVWTPGAGRGFSTTILSVPDANLHIIVLSNARRFLIADKMAKRIASEIINKN